MHSIPSSNVMLPFICCAASFNSALGWKACVSIPHQNREREKHSIIILYFCIIGERAECSFDEHGTSTSCIDGVGSADSFDVYSLNPNLPNFTISLSFQGMCCESSRWPSSLCPNLIFHTISIPYHLYSYSTKFLFSLTKDDSDACL